MIPPLQYFHSCTVCKFAEWVENNSYYVTNHNSWIQSINQSKLKRNTYVYTLYIPDTKLLGPVLQNVYSAIRWINHYPVDIATGLRILIHLIDSDLSGG